ncbi:hypothetical protein BECAL_00714 [Bellilinea caldifistulae]|uniref:SipW-cognate class signal peptide n=1 Tax=Bellilinea caldifistulae TaxID=360411 RepID=A0A0P6XMK3_9CHLR|nr:hypothetical protein [Bellilinea caldifistulae]KPL77620.1 hypothetical protein AC812_03645 [Bellilinea caldifistulae]GAP09570.1 hypothetical protein BECAL_00714 [Bellilinea caldifistulae]
MNKRLPLGFLAILLIVLLAGVGVAYGLWSETLTIDGIVNTGEVNVGFRNVNVEEGVAVNGILTKPEPKEKADAANCYTEILNKGFDNETLQVTTKGAYPSWHCFVTYEVVSTGNVPVHINKPGYKLIYGPKPAWKDLGITECKLFKAGKTTAEEESTCTETDPTKCPPAPSYWQLHEGDKLECKLTIHFNNYEGGEPISENSTYTFQYQIMAYQWNEKP